MVTVSENLLVFRYLMSVAVGMLLGASLTVFILSEECGAKGTISLGGKNYYCAEKYADTIGDE